MLINVIEHILSYKGPIPFATKDECGNYKFHNNAKAIGTLKKYLVVLRDQRIHRDEIQQVPVINYKELTQNN